MWNWRYLFLYCWIWWKNVLRLCSFLLQSGWDLYRYQSNLQRQLYCIVTSFFLAECACGKLGTELCESDGTCVCKSLYNGTNCNQCAEGYFKDESGFCSLSKIKKWYMIICVNTHIIFQLSTSSFVEQSYQSQVWLLQFESRRKVEVLEKWNHWTRSCCWTLPNDWRWRLF